MKSRLSPTFYLKAQRRFGGKYIARKRNRILVSAKNLKELLRLMKARKIPHAADVSIGYVPPSRTSHVYKID